VTDAAVTAAVTAAVRHAVRHAAVRHATRLIRWVRIGLGWLDPARSEDQRRMRRAELTPPLSRGPAKAGRSGISSVAQDDIGTSAQTVPAVATPVPGDRCMVKPSTKPVRPETGTP